MTSKLASLHAGLVARKGEATPAISNPLLSYVDTPRPILDPVGEHVHKSEQDSSTFGADPAAERRVWPPVSRQAAANEVTRPIERPIAAREVERPAPAPDRVVEPAPVSLRPDVKSSPPKTEHVAEDDNDPHRHRFTFRMTNSQRRRLRLAAAVQDESLQHLLSVALDNHLEGLCACSLKSCACLAAAEAEQS